MKSTILKNIFIAFPVFLYLYTIYLRFYDIESFQSIAGEDTLFENIQAVLWISTALVFLLAYIYSQRYKKQAWVKIVLIVFTIISIFWAGEEISWGQRIFDIETIDTLKESNFQGENTLHNTGFIAHILNPTFLISGFVGVFLIYTQDSTVKKYKKVKGLELFKIPPLLTSYFSLLFFVYFIYLLIRPLELSAYTSNIDTKELETAELLLSISVFVYSISVLLNIKKPHKHLTESKK